MTGKENNDIEIAIIVAMQKELDLILPLISGVECLNAEGGLEIYTGVMANRRVAAMKCGIGKVNAALRTQRLIDTCHPAIVINTGVAGGTGNGAGVLDIVVGSRIAYHDVWCGPDTEPGQAAGCPLFFESDAELVALPSLNDGRDPSVKHGLIASGDIFVSRREEVERIKSLYPEAMAVDMESAAIAQACLLNGVRFFCLRVVSDTPGAADNISQYENFWDDAPRHTFECVVALMNDYDRIAK